MYTKVVFLAQRQNIRQWVHRSKPRCSESYNHGADVFVLQRSPQRLQIHTAAVVRCNGAKIEPENLTDPAMGVMRLLGCQDFPARMELASDPQRFHVGHRAATTEMAKRVVEAEHFGDCGNRLLFHRRTGNTAVKCVVVRVDPQRQHVGNAGDRMRRPRVRATQLVGSKGPAPHDGVRGFFLARRPKCLKCLK